MKVLKKVALTTIGLAIIVSCSKEDQTSDSIEEATSYEEELLKDYPEEINMSNWEEFVDAPIEVIDYFNKKELERVKKPQLKFESNYDSKRLIWGDFLLGEIQIKGKEINSATTYLGGTKVTISGGSTSTGTTSSSAPFFQGQNFFLSNIAGDLCFHHQGVSNGDYTFAEWVNGVTALDLVRIQKHILDEEGFEFEELWQYLAADANGDGNITSADITTIQDLILGNITSLPDMDNGSYNQPVIYFQQEDYDYIEADGLLSYLPFITSWYSGLSCQYTAAGAGGLTDTDRYAIKRGDLNGSWNY